MEGKIQCTAKIKVQAKAEAKSKQSLRQTGLKGPVKQQRGPCVTAAPFSPRFKGRIGGKSLIWGLIRKPLSASNAEVVLKSNKSEQGREGGGRQNTKQLRGARVENGEEEIRREER